MESVLGPRDESWLERRSKVSVNILLYLATGNCLKYDAVTYWFYLFQDADRMLGKKKNTGHVGTMIRRKDQFKQKGTERYVLRFGKR